MEIDFKCAFCGKLEVSVCRQGDSIQYHCYACERKYNQEILNKYKKMPIWKKLIFRLTNDLKE